MESAVFTGQPTSQRYQVGGETRLSYALLTISNEVIIPCTELCSTKCQQNMMKDK